MGEIVSQIFVLFLIACTGLLAAKLGYLDDRTTNGLNRLVLSFFVPCMVISSATGGAVSYGHDTVVLALACSAALYVVLPAIAWLLNVAFRLPREKRALGLIMTTCGNVGFMGYPVVQAFFGQEALFLNSLFIMFQAIPLYVGSAILLPQARADEAVPGEIADGRGPDGRAPAKARRRIRLSPRDVINPAMVASVLALVLFFAGIQLPGFLADTLSQLGGVTAPLAMMLMGASLASIDLKSLALDWRLHLYALVKQLVIPLVVWFALSPVFPDPLLLGVLVVVLAMPVAAMIVVLAYQYHADAQFAARGIVATTLWSFLILPVLGIVIAS